MSACTDPSMGDGVDYQDKDKLGLCPGQVRPKVCTAENFLDKLHDHHPPFFLLEMILLL